MQVTGIAINNRENKEKIGKATGKHVPIQSCTPQLSEEVLEFSFV
jgi:hypothetical protein